MCEVITYCTTKDYNIWTQWNPDSVFYNCQFSVKRKDFVVITWSLLRSTAKRTCNMLYPVELECHNKRFSFCGMRWQILVKLCTTWSGGRPWHSDALLIKKIAFLLSNITIFNYNFKHKSTLNFANFWKNSRL